MNTRHYMYSAMKDHFRLSYAKYRAGVRTVIVFCLQVCILHWESHLIKHCLTSSLKWQQVHASYYLSTNSVVCVCILLSSIVDLRADPLVRSSHVNKLNLMYLYYEYIRKQMVSLLTIFLLWRL